MPGVRIVTDSSCDLDESVTADAGIEVVPLKIRFGDDEFVDRVELSVDDFYARMRTSAALPETAAPAPGQFEEAFRRQADAGADAVVCVTISSDLSATIQAARSAATSLGDDLDVRVVDSHSLTAGLGMMALRAAEAAAGGAGAGEIVTLLEETAGRTRVFGALDSLDNLKRGGRIGGAQALLGSLLSIKPVIDVSTGVVEEAAKPRTRKKSLQWLRDKVFEEPIERLAVMHAQADDLDVFLDMLGDRIPRDEIYVGTIGPVIGTHGGRGVMGIAYTVA